MSDPSIGAVASSAPPLMSQEPTSTNSSGSETLVCVAPPSDSVEAAGEPGARALVERFGGHQGAGGTGEVPREPERAGDGPSCSDDAMRAIGTCGSAIGAARGGSATAISAAIGCVGAVESYLECLAGEQRTEKE